MSFPGSSGYIDLSREICNNYYLFGIFLLNDHTGAETEALRDLDHGISHRINIDIFRKWLQGSGAQPVTWRTLVTVLKQMKLLKLAEDIETAIRERGRKTEAGVRKAGIVLVKLWLACAARLAYASVCVCVCVCVCV